jgi:hypothetical protein
MTRLSEDYDYVLHATADSATESMYEYLHNSHGCPIMSPTDAKSALLMAQRALQHQMLLNASLIERIVTLEEKKSKNPFRRK